MAVQPVETPDALRLLGRFASELDWASVPAPVQERAHLVLEDLLAVTVAGGRTEEVRRLVDAWQPPEGPARLLGMGREGTADDAAWLNGTAACCLELDEGNKHAQGHPAAHVAFAALAAAQCSSRPVSGRELLTALVVGYEVASRAGRATQRRADLHTHGHWGALGAAAAAARVAGLDAARTAAAVDAAAGLVYATPWSVVRAGSFVRNLWVGGANVSGLVGARLAAAGLAGDGRTPQRTLGEVVGGWTPDPLVEGLGVRFDLEGGYFKRHASCSYTHPAADAVLALLDMETFRVQDVVDVEVRTHRLAAPLDGTTAGNRLQAMFSIPFVVAAALRDGVVSPASFAPDALADPALGELAARVRVEHDAGLDRRLPEERVSQVEVRLRDGRVLGWEQINPIGDADQRPFTRDDVRAKAARLLGHLDAGQVALVVDELDNAHDVRPLLSSLP